MRESCAGVFCIIFDSSSRLTRHSSQRCPFSPPEAVRHQEEVACDWRIAANSRHPDHFEQRPKPRIQSLVSRDLHRELPLHDDLSYEGMDCSTLEILHYDHSDCGASSALRL